MPSYRSESTSLIRRALLGGAFPLLTALIACFCAKAFAFPGFCDTGDGLWCTGPGLLGYLRYQTGFPDFDPWTQAVSQVLGIVFLAFLIFWSLFIGWLDKKGGTYRYIAAAFQVLCIVLIVISFVKIDDKRIFNPEAPGYQSADTRS